AEPDYPLPSDLHRPGPSFPRKRESRGGKIVAVALEPFPDLIQELRRGDASWSQGIMRHRMSHRGFSRRSAHRKAMFENLAASLLKHEQIRTTLPKAKDLRPIVERL